MGNVNFFEGLEEQLKQQELMMNPDFMEAFNRIKKLEFLPPPEWYKNNVATFRKWTKVNTEDLMY